MEIKKYVLPIIVKPDPNKEEFVFIGNGFLVGSKFISVAHNFPESDWKDLDPEEANYVIEKFEYYVIVEGKAVLIDPKSYSVKQYAPKCDYSDENVDYLDLVVFDHLGLESPSLEFAENDLVPLENGMIKGYFQNDADKEKSLEFQLLLDSLIFCEKECRRVSSPDGTVTYFVDHLEKWHRPKLTNCFSLECSCSKGMSGSPVVDHHGRVLGILTDSTRINDSGKPKSVCMSKSYIGKLLSSQ